MVKANFTRTTEFEEISKIECKKRFGKWNCNLYGKGEEKETVKGLHAVFSYGEKVTENKASFTDTPENPEDTFVCRLEEEGKAGRKFHVTDKNLYCEWTGMPMP